MANDIKLSCAVRTETGKGPMGRLRKTGKLPGVIYGHGENTEMISVDTHEFEQILHHHRGEHLMITLQTEGDERDVLLQAVQHHPVNGSLVHADFFEFTRGEKLHTSIPVVLVGVAEGVKTKGGDLDQLIHELAVICLPKDIIEEIKVDVSALDLNDSLSVADIGLDTEIYELDGETDQIVARVLEPRAAEEETEDDEEAPAAEV